MCGLLKHVAVIGHFVVVFTVKPPPLSYGVEKRSGHINCVGGSELSVVPPLLTTITQGGGRGDFTVKKTTKCRITETCFSNPHTDFGAPRSRRLEEVPFFLVTLACLDISSKKRCL